MRVQPQENQHTILDAIPTKIKGEISIIQHNTGKREEIQQSLLEIAAKRKGDIIALQEPHACEDGLGVCTNCSVTRVRELASRTLFQNILR